MGGEGRAAAHRASRAVGNTPEQGRVHCWGGGPHAAAPGLCCRTAATATLCAQAEPQGGTAQPRLQPSGTQLPAVWAEPDTNSIAQSSNRIRGWLCCPSSPVHLEMRGTAFTACSPGANRGSSLLLPAQPGAALLPLCKNQACFKQNIYLYIFYIKNTLGWHTGSHLQH